MASLLHRLSATRLLAAFAITLGAAGITCSSGVAECVTGSQQSCGCPNGAPDSIQVCSSDNTYGECSCGAGTSSSSSVSSVSSGATGGGGASASTSVGGGGASSSAVGGGGAASSSSSGGGAGGGATSSASSSSSSSAGGAPSCPDTGPGIGGGSNCSSNTVAHVGTGAFHVFADFKTAQTGRVALANQRATCTATSTFWEMVLVDGIVVAETSGGTPATDTVLRGCKLVNDDANHLAVLTRFGGVLTLYVDGAEVASAPSTASFGDLPAVQHGHEDACAAVNGTQAVTGFASVCVEDD